MALANYAVRQQAHAIVDKEVLSDSIDDATTGLEAEANDNDSKNE